MAGMSNEKQTHNDDDDEDKLCVYPKKKEKCEKLKGWMGFFLFFPNIFISNVKHFVWQTFLWFNYMNYDFDKYLLLGKSTTFLELSFRET